MEEKPLKASAKSGRHDSVMSISRSDIRNLWSTATLSQAKLNVQLSNIYDDSDESSSIHSKTSQWYNQEKMSQDSDSVVEEWKDRKVSHKPETEQDLSSSLVDLEGDKYSRTQAETSFKTSKRTHHRAYWVEQQNRLPLPLTELMENEVLEILTKALQSYRSQIGKNHFLTKQLQRSIESLKRRRNKRQHVFVH